MRHFQVLTTVTVKIITVLCNVTPYNLGHSYSRFERMYYADFTAEEQEYTLTLKKEAVHSSEMCYPYRRCHSQEQSSQLSNLSVSPFL
jgi:hypothetical protein